MTYDDINFLTSHAWTMATRAASNITNIENLLWDIKVRYSDAPNRRKVEETNTIIAMTREQLKKALAGLDQISEEMKTYRKQ